MECRSFKGDKWNRLFGYAIPCDAIVQVVRFGPRRKVLVRWNGQLLVTMLWYLGKIPPAQVSTQACQKRRAEC